MAALFEAFYLLNLTGYKIPPYRFFGNVQLCHLDAGYTSAAKLDKKMS